MGVRTAFLACLFLLFVAALARANPVNVKDFGAKGDGRTDDTEALRAAIANVELDLDRTPWLTWKQKPVGTDSPGTYAVRVLDIESGQELLLTEDYYPPWDDYRAYNLREMLGVSGVRKLRIKYYYLGVKSEHKKSITAKPGDYIVLDFLRAEAD